MANEKNLIPISERTESERKEIATKGGIASGTKRRENATLRDICQNIMKMPIKNGSLDEITSISQSKGKNVIGKEAMMLALAKKGINGDIPAISKLIEILGIESENNSQDGQEENTFTKALNGKAVEVWEDEE